MGRVRIFLSFLGTLPLVVPTMTRMASLVMDPKRWKGQQHTRGLRCF